MTHSKNVQTALNILKNEVDGDVQSALEKMSDDYSMTWMYQGREELFPTSSINVKSEMDEVYVIKGRKYDIRNIAESENVVMLEMIESYPDSDTGKIYKTPQVIVLEFEDGKIKTGRHYNDPQVSRLDLTDAQIDDALRGSGTQILVD